MRCTPLPTGGSAAGELSEEEEGLLRRYVNGGYLSQGNWAKVQSKFGEDGSVQLHNFLAPAWAQQVAQVRPRVWPGAALSYHIASSLPLLTALPTCRTLLRRRWRQLMRKIS